MAFACWRLCHWAAACFFCLFGHQATLLSFSGVTWHIFCCITFNPCTVDTLELLHRGLLADTYFTCLWPSGLKQNTLHALRRSQMCMFAQMCLPLHPSLCSHFLSPILSLLTLTQLLPAAWLWSVDELWPPVCLRSLLQDPAASETGS